MLPRLATASSGSPQDQLSDDASVELVSPMSSEVDIASRIKDQRNSNALETQWNARNSLKNTAAPISTSTKSRIRGSWMVESAGALLSILCFAAMLGVLIPVNGRPITSWPSIVSPNAVISLLSTIGKAALLLPITAAISQLKWVSVQNRVNTMENLDTYDQASRGPLGSLWLLYHFRLRPMLVAWGALLVVISVAVDPFTQLLLHVEPHMTQPKNDKAFIPMSNAYDFDSPQKTDMPRDTTMRAAIVATMYGLNSDLPYTCSSGNCRWSDFSTLAVCSKCQNVTAQLNYNCRTSRVRGEYMSYRCNFSFPGGATFSREPGPNISVRSLDVPSPALDASAISLFDHMQSKSIGLANISTLRFADFDNEYQQFHAEECRLSWCEQMFHNTHSINGTLQWANVTESDLQIEDPESNPPTFIPVSGGRPPTSSNRRYTINALGWSDMSNLLTSIFTPSGISDDNHVTSTEQRKDALTGNSIEEDFIRLLAYNDNTGQVVDALATAMSNQIRQGKGSTQFRGEAWRSEAFYYVRWPVYIFHAAFALLGIAFTVFVVVWSERSRAQAWKSSSLALLFAELKGWDRTDVMAIGTPQGLKAAAEKMRGGVVDENEPLIIERASV